ncbi:MAG: Ldh family oxidoreductase [Acidimicrobiales bacterium]
MTVLSATSRVTPEKLRSFADAVLVGAGMPDDDAAVSADAMVWSDLRGAHAHGVTGRLPKAVDQLTSGAKNPTPRCAIVRETVTTTVFDADGGWGQAAGTSGMRVAIAKAGKAGVGVTMVRNASTTAALGWYATLAVKERMIGLVINNTLPILAPWGGTTKLLGNQPFAIGAPADRHPPLLFDSALAALSWNAIHALQERGESLPPGMALTAGGDPTVDPDEAIAGLIFPAGGHRGYGLALMWEVLTGVLARGLMAPDVGKDASTGRPMGVSMFCLAIDPTVAMPYETFTARVDALVDQIHACPPQPGVDRVRVPGERGHELAAIHAREGVPVPPERAARLREVGERFGVPWDDDVVPS